MTREEHRALVVTLVMAGASYSGAIAEANRQRDETIDHGLQRDANCVCGAWHADDIDAALAHGSRWSA